MKTVILAGGLGSRLAEETELLPKPMVEIGGRPILWHILKYYASFGHLDFAVALGYKGEVIKRYFLDSLQLDGDMALDLKARKVARRSGVLEPWRLELVETGVATMTGGRLKRLGSLLKGGTFLMTYGDGLATVDLKALLKFHRAHGKLATVTVVRPPARFGVFEFRGDRVTRFEEKPQVGEGWINGGYFVLEPEVLDYIPGDASSWELEPMQGLVRDAQLMAYRHADFWQCMDTLRDKKYLQSLWAAGQAPWKNWRG